MSQLVATQPTSIFEQRRDFSNQNGYTSDQPAYSYPNSAYEFDGYDPTKDPTYYSYYQYSMQMYNMYSGFENQFSTNFPRAKNYYTQESIIEAFPHLEGLNDVGFDINTIPEHAQFFILRSGNDDNIHKAIKYHTWSTTTGGKATLSNAWKEAEKKGLTPEIYLVFSVVNSNHFLGIAKMTSDINDEETFKFWWEPAKWFGSFQLKWLFIKDIHASKFDYIQEENVGNLKDSSRLSLENGKEVLKLFRDFVTTSSIFVSFPYMDAREDYIRFQRDNADFNKYFDECCVAYKSNPESFSPLRKPGYPKKSSKYYGNRRPGNYYSRKTYYSVKPQNGAPAGLKTQEFLSESEYPPLSLAEEFGIKTQLKKKQPKEKKNASDSDEKKDEVKGNEELSN